MLFARSKRAKRLSITVKSDLSVRVAIPRGCPTAAARAFLHVKTPWIRKSLQKFRKTGNIETTEAAPVDRTRARARLIARLNHLAAFYGFEYNKVAIRNQKTRWGSCSDKNNINLNMHLVRLPDHLIDYVIVHELLHTRIKNHTKRFWSELARYVPDPKACQKELRNYHCRP